MQEHSIWIPIVLKIGTAGLICEFLIYIYLFVYLYKYTSGLQILTLEKKKSRNKSNAQTLFGQFVLFISLSAHIVFMSLAFSTGKNAFAADTKDLGVIVKSLEFGLFSLVHCLLIPELRVSFKKIVKKVTKIE
jgi:hypothetical protein